MDPVHAAPEEVAYWAARDQAATVVSLEIGGPEEGEDVTPCPALVAVPAGTIHVRFELDEIELAQLANGGKLWLTTWGPLPVHLLEIIPKEALDGL